MNEQVVVFGGMGFIGHRIAIKLAQDYRVLVVDYACLDRAVHPEILRRSKALELSGVETLHLDINDTERLSASLKGRSINTVYHLAGASSIKKTYCSDGFEQIVQLTNRLLNVLETCAVKRIVYFSSSMIYGDFTHSTINESHSKKPVDRYGVYKLVAETMVSGWALENDVVSVIIRPTAVYGPHDIEQRLVAKFFAQARLKVGITIAGDGSQKLDFTYVDDVVIAAVATMQCTSSDEYNVSFGHARSINELVSLIRQYYPESNVEHNFSLGHPTAKRGGLNSDKAIRLLGFEPSFSLERGLAETMLQEGIISRLPQNLHENAKQPIPLGRADILDLDVPSVINVLQTGWLTTGPSNTQFESQFVEYLACDLHALTVNSCASALFLALQAHNINGGVIVPSFTFSATINAVVRAGATPQFVDIEQQYLGIDASKLEHVITDITQAILVVHLAGTICDIEEITAIARKYDLIVIEDCAQALGAEYKGAKAGTFGVTSCFSFFPTKMITTGEGGMLVTRDSEVYKRAKALANHGYDSSTLDRESQLKPWLREQCEIGFNFRMSGINAALGVAQMHRLTDIVSNRRKKALKIVSKLRSINGIQVFEYTDRYCVYQALNILLPKCGIDREEFVLHLRAEGLMASVHYPKILPESSVFRNYVSDFEVFPNARDIADRIVTLPLFASITELQINRIVAAVRLASVSFGLKQVITE